MRERESEREREEKGEKKESPLEWTRKEDNYKEEREREIARKRRAETGKGVFMCMCE